MEVKSIFRPKRIDLRVLEGEKQTVVFKNFLIQQIGVKFPLSVIMLITSLLVVSEGQV